MLGRILIACSTVMFTNLFLPEICEFLELFLEAVFLCILIFNIDNSLLPSTCTEHLYRGVYLTDKVLNLAALTALTGAIQILPTLFFFFALTYNGERTCVW